MKTKQAIRISLNLFKKKKSLSKTWESTHSIANLGRKSKPIPCSLKHSCALLFNPAKIAET